MKRNFFRMGWLLSLVILLLTGLCRPSLGVEPHRQFNKPSATGPPPAALLPFLPKNLPSGSNFHLDYVEVPPEDPSRGRGLLAAAYGYWEKDSGLSHSRILVVGLDPAAGLPQLLWQSEDEDLYDPVVILEPDLHYRGRPVVLVERRGGLTWGQIDVIGFSGQQPRLLYTRDDCWYKLVRLSPGAAPQLLAYMSVRVPTLGLPEVLEWNGEKFVEASNKYPYFFDELILEKDCVPIEIAILKALAGRRSEAILQMEEILRAEQNKYGHEAAMERMLNVLKSKPGPYFVRDF